MLNYGLSINTGYLKRNVRGFSSSIYVRSSNDSSQQTFNMNVSDAVRLLKNTFNKTLTEEYFKKKNYIRTIATNAIKDIISLEHLSNVVIVCVPRSKASFSQNQLLFRKAINEAADLVPGAINGVNFLNRRVDTATTHLKNTSKGDMSGDGSMPFPGITSQTCSWSGNIHGKNVILVDDIYTRNVNIDEDCAQFLLDKGADSVTMYTLCKTPEYGE